MLGENWKKIITWATVIAKLSPDVPKVFVQTVAPSLSALLTTIYQQSAQNAINVNSSKTLFSCVTFLATELLVVLPTPTQPLPSASLKPSWTWAATWPSSPRSQSWAYPLPPVQEGKTSRVEAICFCTVTLAEVKRLRQPHMMSSRGLSQKHKPTQ